MSEKICVIVGVGPGLGMALARRFGQEGFRIALISRRREVLEGYAQELEKANVTASVFPADAESSNSLRNALNAVTREIGAPSVLIYNAAVMQPANPSGLGVEKLVREFRINVAGALVATQEVLPGMLEAKSGTVLFTGGGLALDPWPEVASLAIGKAGIRSLAHSLAKELEPKGIHVATVTIDGIVKSSGPLKPDDVVANYWELHQEAAGSWRREIVVKP